MKKRLLLYLYSFNKIDKEFYAVLKCLRFNPHFTTAHCATQTGVNIKYVKILRDRLDRNGWLAGWTMQNEQAAKRTLT